MERQGNFVSVKQMKGADLDWQILAVYQTLTRLSIYIESRETKGSPSQI